MNQNSEFEVEDEGGGQAWHGEVQTLKFVTINGFAFSVRLLSQKTLTRLKFLNMEKEMEKWRRKMAMMRDRLSSHTFHMSTLAGD